MQNTNTMQDRGNSIAIEDTKNTPIPKSYLSKLPVRLGAVFGVMGSFLIMAVIALLTLSTGEDIWRSPRIIASLFMGEAANTGVLPIIIGTIIHLILGASFGAIFARIVPKLPRPIWIVAGILFGLALWAGAAYLLPLFVDTGDISSANYFGGLLIANVVFGINLGLAGALYGLFNVSDTSY